MHSSYPQHELTKHIGALHDKLNASQTIAPVRTFMPNIDTPVTGEMNFAMNGGDLGIVIGMPNHGKTPVMTYMASKCANALREAGMGDRRVFYITLESSAEDVRFKFAHRYDLGIANMAGKPKAEIMGALAPTDPLPLITIGDSLGDPTAGHSLTLRGSNHYRPTMRSIMETMLTIFDGLKIVPHAVFIDHFHMLHPASPEHDETSRYLRAADELIQFCRECKRPVIVAAQTVQKEIEKRARDSQQPRMTELRYASTLVDYARDIWSVWHPYKTFEEDSHEVSVMQRDGVRVGVPTKPGYLIVKNVKGRFSSLGGTSEVLNLRGKDGIECMRFQNVQLNTPSNTRKLTPGEQKMAAYQAQQARDAALTSDKELDSENEDIEITN